MRNTLKLCVGSLLLGLSTVSQATPITFTATGTRPETGSLLAASATFDVVGSQLFVTLTNTSTDDVRAPVDILQAVLWDMDQTINLSLVSATVSSLCNFPGGKSAGTCGAGATYTGSDLLTKYAYSANPDGIGSAGLGIFGDQVDGMDYGILSTGDDLATYTQGMKNKNPYVKDNTYFVLDISKNGGSYAPSGTGELNLGNVRFNYGTDTFLITSDPTPPTGVPEPPTWTLAALFAGLIWLQQASRVRVQKCRVG
jgi:hypothetical protein